MNLFDVVTRSVQLVGGRFTNEDKSSINKYKSELAAISDEELRARLRVAIQGVEAQKQQRSRGALNWAFSFLPQFLNRKNQTTLNNIALAIEAFNRAPADLPAGSRLYQEQIQAAINLTRRCLLQMDTGEGKTYALLPAAFALACEHYCVYIVCANEYLAWRDANRTGPFWEFVGLPLGLCLESTSSANWSQRVIYTTLETLVFRHLRNTISIEKAEPSLLFSSVLLDEADAILLDQATSPFTLIQDINSAAFDWTFALDYARDLVEEEDILTNLNTLNANLTVAGEQQLRARTTSDPANAGLKYLMTRHAVEVAYVALKVVDEEKDYVVEGDKIYAIDRVTGKIQRNITPRWIIPLEFMRGSKFSAERITLDSISPVTVLKKFRHMAGMSGTIADDALEYLFTYLLPTQIIPPRRKRFNGLLPDQVFLSKKEASQKLRVYALEQARNGRAVLIGTQTIVDAEQLYQQLFDKLPPGVNLRLLTGKNDRQAAEIFAKGGEAGSLIIATQLAGRGVDIRLADAVRETGGLLLISLGRSMTLRYDKQFAGRAGRQGDPFEARFFCSCDDELLKRFVGQKTKRLLESLGQEEGESIDSKFVSKRITAAQQQNRQYQFGERRQALATNVAYLQIRESMEIWFEYLQIPYEKDHQDADQPEIVASAQCSITFMEWVVDHFIEENLASLLKGKHDISEENADQIAGTINQLLDLNTKPRQIFALDITGHTQASATTEIRARLLIILNEALQRYWELYHQAMNSISPVGSYNLNGSDDNLPAPLNSIELSTTQFVKILRRSPRQTAYWSILSCWIEFQQEGKRLQHRAAARSRSPLEFYRAVTDQTLAEWAKAEGFIAPKVLKSLAHCDQAWRNDELFVYEDNKVWQPGATHEVPYDWQQSTEKPDKDLDDANRLTGLVQQFVAQSAAMLDRHFTKSQLIRLLNDFTHSYPLHMLQNPTHIQRVLKDVITDQIATGVGEERRKKNKKWLRLFLIFLRERKLIGTLPTFQHRIQSAFTQLLKNVAETRTALTVGGLAVFLVVFGLLTHFGHVAAPKQLGAFGSVVDALLFDRLLAAGGITAPAFGCLILADLFLAGVFRSGFGRIKGIGVDRLIVFGLQLFLAAWLAPWPFGTFTTGRFFSALLIFLTILIIARITQKLAWWLENDSGLSLTSGWLSYCVAFALIPLVSSQYPGDHLLVIGFATTAIIFYVSQEFNKSEIQLVSTRLVNSERSMGVEELLSSTTVEGNCGAVPQIYALLLAWIAYQILDWLPMLQEALIKPDLLSYLPTAIYLAATFAWTKSILHRRLQPSSWAEDLNTKHQAIQGVDSRESLQVTLQGIRNKLLVRELIVQATVIVMLAVALRNYKLLNTWFPVAIVLAFSAYLFGDQSRRFVLQLYRLIFTRVPYSSEALDLSKMVVPEDEPSPPERIKRFVENWIGVIITVGVTLIEGIDFLHKAWDWIRTFRSH